MTAYPLLLVLPGGLRARVRIEQVTEIDDDGKAHISQLVHTPPIYELDDGTTVDVDVTIPDDLAALGWFWAGSGLRWDGGDALRGIVISTGCFGIPGVFDIARCYELKRADLVAQRVARQAMPTKKPRRSATQPPRAPTTVQQLAMEL